ncbi:MAG: hypothetical protein OEM38_09250 [Gammaproteobacteria bacterium]|nr:hypothetical protein [Gammaproteobacteria bacterium]
MNRQSHIPAILVILLTVIMAAMTYLYITVPDVKQDGVVTMLLGNLVAGWLASVNFWIGSNRKDQPADITNKKDSK